jgi:hypothetical protein
MQAGRVGTFATQATSTPPDCNRGIIADLYPECVARSRDTDTRQVAITMKAAERLFHHESSLLNICSIIARKFYRVNSFGAKLCT